MNYGMKLNPKHSLRNAYGINGTRQKVIIMHNPSEIDHNQLLLVRFPNMGSDNIIVPGMVNLSFNIELSLTADTKRMPQTIIPLTNSKILKDPCFIFPIVVLKFKVTANMNTYDYP